MKWKENTGKVREESRKFASPKCGNHGTCSHIAPLWGTRLKTHPASNPLLYNDVDLGLLYIPCWFGVDLVPSHRGGTTLHLGMLRLWFVDMTIAWFGICNANWIIKALRSCLYAKMISELSIQRWPSLSSTKSRKRKGHFIMHERYCGGGGGGERELLYSRYNFKTWSWFFFYLLDYVTRRSEKLRFLKKILDSHVWLGSLSPGYATQVHGAGNRCISRTVKPVSETTWAQRPPLI